MTEIKIKFEFVDHDKVILTNQNGDTYTSKSEGLMDFLHSTKPESLPAPTQDGTAEENIESYWLESDDLGGGMHLMVFKSDYIRAMHLKKPASR